MKRGLKSAVLAALVCLPVVSVAEQFNLNLDQLVERAVNTDPRIAEQQKNVAVARALLDEVLGHGGLTFDVSSFVALTTTIDGGFFESGVEKTVRSDKYANWTEFTPWSSVQFSVIKPLYTFGKISNYSDAARANIDIKQEDVRLQRGETIYDMSRAYYGYLTARDICRLFNDVIGRLDGAIVVVERLLEKGDGGVLLSDLYALQTGQAIISRYLVEGQAARQTAMEGMKLLAGLDKDDELILPERRLRPVPVPKSKLVLLQKQAMTRRPEMLQLKAGLKARRSLVLAARADKRPNLFAGIAGTAAYTPGRSRLDNPFVYDPFNDYGATPLLGLQWNYIGGVASARVDKAQAELDALLEKSRFAQSGIPFQVSDQYRMVQASYEGVKKMTTASKAGRRWMVSSYANFEAGIEDAEDALTAFQGYVLAHSDYLKLVNDYNLQVVKLKQLTGEY